MADPRPDMSPSAIRKRMIGSLDPASSHPSTLAARARTFLILAATPAGLLITGFLILLAWSFLEPEAGIRMLLRIGQVLRFLVPLLGFLAGFASCGLLILLASKAAVGFREWGAGDGGGVAWLAVGTLFVGLVGLGLINYSGDGRVEILGHVLMVLPFVSTISILVVIAERRRRGALWWVWLGLPMVILALLYLSVMTGSGVRWVADGVEDAIGPVLEQLRAEGLLGDLEHTIRAIVAILLFCGLGLWAVLWSPWQPEESDRGDTRPPGPLLRIWRFLTAPLAWFRKLFGVDEERSEGQEPEDASAWVRSILAANHARPWRWEAAEAREDEDPAGFVDASNGCRRLELNETWGSLFLDAPITQDQAAAIETFVGVRGDSIGRSHRPGVLPDVLLESDEFGGGLETLAASVVAAVLLRGQGALVVVPSDAVLRQLRDRIQAVLSHIHVDGLISCCSIVDRGGISADGVDVPQILVGRVQDVEASFFDSSLDDGARRVLLAGIGGVFVAGLMDFEQEDRLELPLLIHKFRIFQISIRNWVQVLVLCSPMDDLSHLREQVRSSLFSHVYRDEVCRLGRRWIPDARVVLPTLGDDDSRFRSICDVSASCAGAWGCVVVVSAGLARERATEFERRIAAELQTRLEEPPRVHVVGATADFESVMVESRSSWVLVIEDGRSESARMAAQLDLPRLATRIVLASLPVEHGGRDSIRSSRDVLVPVLGGDKTQGLWIRHAASLIELLQVSAPIERRDWGQFGLPRVGEIPSFEDLLAEGVTAEHWMGDDTAHSDGGLVIEVAGGFELECDPPDRRRRANVKRSGDARQSDDSQGILEWVSRPRNRQSTRAITLDPERDHRIAMRSGNEIIAVRMPRSSGRIAVWHADSVDIPLRRRFDLAREISFLRSHEGRWFAPSSVALTAEGRVRIKAETQPSEHLKQAMQFSLWQADVDFTIRPEIEHWRASESTLQGDNVAFLECRALGRDRLTARGAGLELRGLVSTEGGSLDASLDRFVYSAGLSALCIGMGSSRQLETHGLHGGIWSTRDDRGESAARGFDPLLSAAFHSALERQAPGIGRLGRPLAFHDEAGGTAFVFLEPWDSMGAFWKVLKLILKEDVLRRRLVRETSGLMSKALADANAGCSLRIATARCCGLGFDTDAPHDGAAAALALESLEQG